MGESEEFGPHFRPTLKSREHFSRQESRKITRRRLLQLGAIGAAAIAVGGVLREVFGEDQENKYQKEAKKALAEATEEDLLTIKVTEKEGSPLRSSPIVPERYGDNRIGHLKEGEVVNNTIVVMGRHPETGSETKSWLAFENPHHEGQVVFSYRGNFEEER